ncbi:hypothetical protein [Rosettibacter firmus]|uniref:hypothetical protein n=1 Tax=Rosettibacter firmus TaxID=3111522 RepID=UPI00336C0E2C
MTINNQYIIQPVGEYLEAKINSASIKHIHEVKKESEYNSLLKNFSDDKKFTVVTENLDKEKHLNELRFQENTPVAQLLETKNIFNETKKVSSKKEKKQFSSFNFSKEEFKKAEESKNEKGFYIIIDGMLIQPDNYQKNLSYMERRINKAYRINIPRDPGTLINVIA